VHDLAALVSLDVVAVHRDATKPETENVIIVPCVSVCAVFSMFVRLTWPLDSRNLSFSHTLTRTLALCPVARVRV
jgi:hypothetical protein